MLDVETTVPNQVAEGVVPLVSTRVEAIDMLLTDLDLAGVLVAQSWAQFAGPLDNPIVRLLGDLPVTVEERWIADQDLVPAMSAARRLAQRRKLRERYARPQLSVGEAEREDAADWHDAYVLVHGPLQRRYDLADKSCGTLDLGLTSIEVVGLPESPFDQPVWVYGLVTAALDAHGTWSYYVFTDPSLVVPDAASHGTLPRWRGHTRAASLGRAIWMRNLIPRIDFSMLGDAVSGESLRKGLLAIHCSGDKLLDPHQRMALEAGTIDCLTLLVRAITSRVMEATPTGVAALPPPRLVKGADAAEEYAAEVLRSLGFRDARRTPKGADGGVDVIGDGLVCQVKFEALPTGRPPLQALYGIAQLEAAKAVFFSLAGYSPHALEWADRADIACLEFAADGTVSGSNDGGRALISGLGT